MKRVLVTGGRNYSNYEAVNAALTAMRPDWIATGGASGADRLAELWAYNNHVPCTVYPAEWSRYGRAAGPIRNKQMLFDFKPTDVLAFAGGRGTANMVSTAKEAGVLVEEVAC